MHKNIELLSTVSNTMVSNRVMDEILQLTVRITASALGYKICSIMLVDEERGVLVPKATQSLSGRYQSRSPLPIKASISGLAVLEKRAIAVPNVLKDHRYSRPDLAKSEGLVSMLAVPMMSKGKAVGALNVYTSKPHEFKEEEVAVIQSVANQAAVALEGIQDALTGTYSRRYLDQGLERYLLDGGRRDIPVSLVLLDIDFFKVINDLHGHAFGDLVLREVANGLRRVLRSTDVIIRYGGDEFLLVLPEVNRERAQITLSKAMDSVASLSLETSDGRIVRLTLSGGIAVFPEDGDRFDLLLMKTDEELRTAKRTRFERV